MKLPYFFLLLQQPKPMCDALVDMLKASGAKSLAVVYVDDLFGLENYAALKVALQGSGHAVHQAVQGLVVQQPLPVTEGQRLRLLPGHVAQTVGERLERVHRQGRQP